MCFVPVVLMCMCMCVTTGVYPEECLGCLSTPISQKDCSIGEITSPLRITCQEVGALLALDGCGSVRLFSLFCGRLAIRQLFTNYVRYCCLQVARSSSEHAHELTQSCMCTKVTLHMCMFYKIVAATFTWSPNKE